MYSFKEYNVSPMKLEGKIIHYPHALQFDDKKVPACKVIITAKMAQSIKNSIKIIKEKLREK